VVPSLRVRVVQCALSAVGSPGRQGHPSRFLLAPRSVSRHPNQILAAHRPSVTVSSFGPRQAHTASQPVQVSSPSSDARALPKAAIARWPLRTARPKILPTGSGGREVRVPTSPAIDCPVSQTSPTAGTGPGHATPTSPTSPLTPLGANPDLGPRLRPRGASAQVQVRAQAHKWSQSREFYPPPQSTGGIIRCTSKVLHMFKKRGTFFLRSELWLSLQDLASNLTSWLLLSSQDFHADSRPSSNWTFQPFEFRTRVPKELELNTLVSSFQRKCP
jgi:hypothetical protein